MTTALVDDTHVWVPCPTCVWRPGHLISVTPEEFVIEFLVGNEEGRDLDSEQPSKEVVHLPRSAGGPLLLRRNPELFGDGALDFDNLKDVPILHEPAVLHAVSVRFQHGRIYTFCGRVLLAVNPFRMISGLYSSEMLHQSTGSGIKTPHVFTVANWAFRGVAEQGMSQTVLISGESGAGKTETTKFVMQFLTMAGKSDLPGASRIEQQVLGSNPMLEAFGNAKTLRNDNSSRFGKYIELQFNQSGRGNCITKKFCGVEDSPGSKRAAGLRLTGARIFTYLLEKVRITNLVEGERGFHIFYQAVAAAQKLPPGEDALIVSVGSNSIDSITARSGGPSLAELGFDSRSLAADDRGTLSINLCGFKGYNVSDFSYLGRSSCEALSGEINEAGDFEITVAAMQTIGLNGEEISEILNCLAAVMHLGNLVFGLPSDEVQGSQVLTDEVTGLTGDATNRLRLSCSLLGVDEASLEVALCQRTIQTPGAGEKIRKLLSVGKAGDGRDALARFLYHGVFVHIVARTNSSIGSDDEALFCGLLDIFGFEFFKTNSFEQLCINFTNELLQQYFNKFIFETEQDLYAQEDIHWNLLDFPDNHAIVELLQSKPGGIFPMLDEECLVVGGTSSSWMSKLCNEHDGKHANFETIKHRPDVFVVNHFAGPVEYTAEGFLEKNRDELSPDLLECLRSSSKDFMRSLCDGYDRVHGTQSRLSNSEDGSTKSRRMKAKMYSVSSDFRHQLQILMEKIQSTAPNFVRCIKPNEEKEPCVFDALKVGEQLRYQGVLQAIELSRAGYPVRMLHAEVFFTFRCILKRELREQLQGRISQISCMKQVACDLLESLREDHLKDFSDGWTVGKTRVFFRDECVNHLYTVRAGKCKIAAVTIQASWKQHVCRRHYLRCRSAINDLQAGTRSFLCRARYLRCRYLIIRMQACARGRSCCAHYRTCRRSAIKIQACSRRNQRRRQYLKCRCLIIRLQAYARRNACQREYLAWRKMIIMLQARARGMSGRRSYLATRQAVIRLQARARGKPYRVHYLACRSSATEIQTLARVVAYRQQFLRCRRAAVTLQAEARQILCHKSYRRCRHLIIRLQARARKRACQKRYLTWRQGFIKFQARARGVRVHRSYLRFLFMIIRLQARARGNACRRELRDGVERHARTLQTAMRMLEARASFLRHQKAACEIQALLRMQSCIEFRTELHRRKVASQQCGLKTSSTGSQRQEPPVELEVPCPVEARPAPPSPAANMSPKSFPKQAETSVEGTTETSVVKPVRCHVMDISEQLVVASPLLPADENGVEPPSGSVTDRICLDVKAGGRFMHTYTWLKESEPAWMSRLGKLRWWVTVQDDQDLNLTIDAEVSVELRGLRDADPPEVHQLQRYQQIKSVCGCFNPGPLDDPPRQVAAVLFRLDNSFSWLNKKTVEITLAHERPKQASVAALPDVQAQPRTIRPTSGRCSPLKSLPDLAKPPVIHQGTLSLESNVIEQISHIIAAAEDRFPESLGDMWLETTRKEISQLRACCLLAMPHSENANGSIVSTNQAKECTNNFQDHAKESLYLHKDFSSSQAGAGISYENSDVVQLERQRACIEETTPGQKETKVHQGYKDVINQENGLEGRATTQQGVASVTPPPPCHQPVTTTPPPPHRHLVFAASPSHHHHPTSQPSQSHNPVCTLQTPHIHPATTPKPPSHLSSPGVWINDDGKAPSLLSEAEIAHASPGVWLNDDGRVVYVLANHSARDRHPLPHSNLPTGEQSGLFEV